MSAARDRWLDEGLSVLAEGGAAAVRIDRIAARLKLSKGSFHHHFTGADDYKRALLAHYRDLAIRALEKAIADAGASAPGPDILAHLTELISPANDLYRPELAVAVRAWATWDPDARATQRAVDDAVLAALERVWRTLVADAATARRSALVPYLIAVGASVVEPPIDGDDLREVYRLLLPLVPAAGKARGR